MEYSKIFLSMSNFLDLKKNTQSKKIRMKKKRKNKNYNINQKSFYFEDYLETNKKNKLFKKK